MQAIFWTMLLNCYFLTRTLSSATLHVSGTHGHAHITDRVGGKMINRPDPPMQTVFYVHWHSLEASPRPYWSYKKLGAVTLLA